MSLQTNNNLSLVHCRQMAKGEFDHIVSKDPCTIYFVNETGVFTGQSLDEEGDIYLGDNLLTGGEKLIHAYSGIWVSAQGETQGENNFVYNITSLNNASLIEISADLMLVNQKSTKDDVVFYMELVKNINSTYNVETALAQTIISVPAARSNETTIGNAHLEAMIIGGGRTGSFAIRIGWQSGGNLTPVHYNVNPNDSSKTAPVSKFDIRAWSKKS